MFYFSLSLRYLRLNPKEYYQIKKLKPAMRYKKIANYIFFKL